MTTTGKCPTCDQYWDNHGLAGTIVVCPTFEFPPGTSQYTMKKPEQFPPVRGDDLASRDPRPDWLPDDFRLEDPPPPPAWTDEWDGGH